ncbi:MAG: bifunctional folylpolyglutamate synthase/dihydrofolate synthase [Clostridia bacterium]|nr:bifunctional folylpolyglutamate synthase/dihydrofolate synthase [Clostridia bacterium]
MLYSQALEYIHSLNVFGIKPGLERMQAALEILGNPQDKLQFVHLAGTNGKGSTSTFIAKALEYTGKKVGLYTSPFVIDFRERIQINGEYISENDLSYFTQKIIDTKIELTEFEFITTLAFLYFCENACDIVVLETGLGGRLDATNVIENPLCCVITKIDYDHTAILGDTIEKIAFEKCGIIKSGAKVVCYPYQSKQAMSVITKYAPKVILPDLNQLCIDEQTFPNNRFVYKSSEFTTSLCGRYQVYNAITALETLCAVGVDISAPKVQKAFFDAFIPARMEVISSSPLVILDGAHNPDGANALSGVMSHYSNVTAIVGMMADKDIDLFLQKTTKLCKNIITVKVQSNPRSISAEQLKEKVSCYNKNVFIADSHQDAINLAKKLSGGNPIFVFGSLYLAGEIRPLLKSAF